MKNLKKARRKRNLSIQALATAVGITELTMLRYENGERRIPPNIRQKILQVLASTPIEPTYAKINKMRLRKCVPVHLLKKEARIADSVWDAMKRQKKSVGYSAANILGKSPGRRAMEYLESLPEVQLPSAEKQHIFDTGYIKFKRMYRGLLQREVAEQLGISRLRYLNLEANPNMSLEDEEKINAILDTYPVADYYTIRQQYINYLSRQGKL